MRTVFETSFDASSSLGIAFTLRARPESPAIARPDVARTLRSAVGPSLARHPV